MDKDSNAPNHSTGEAIIKLYQCGWTVEEIARTLRISKGEVELILEFYQGED